MRTVRYHGETPGAGDDDDDDDDEGDDDNDDDDLSFLRRKESLRCDDDQRVIHEGPSGFAWVKGATPARWALQAGHSSSEQSL